MRLEELLEHAAQRQERLLVRADAVEPAPVAAPHHAEGEVHRLRTLEEVAQRRDVVDEAEEGLHAAERHRDAVERVDDRLVDTVLCVRLHPAVGDEDRGHLVEDLLEWEEAVVIRDALAVELEERVGDHRPAPRLLGKQLKVIELFAPQAELEHPTPHRGPERRGEPPLRVLTCDGDVAVGRCLCAKRVALVEELSAA